MSDSDTHDTQQHTGVSDGLESLAEVEVCATHSTIALGSFVACIQCFVDEITR